MSNLTTQLNSVLKSAPELGQSPGLSVGVAQAGGDTSGNAQAVARGTQVISDDNAHQQVSQSVGGDISDALNWFGNHVAHAASDVGSDIVQGAEKAGGAVMNTMNKGLQVVQHEYRYLHDVEARHGMGAALLEGIGIAAGAAAGFYGGGFYGAELGAEGATALEGQLFYHDSWERTTNGNTYVDPNTGQPVSIGRDITSELSHIFPELDRGTTAYKITSGLIDGIADMQVGGTEVLGLAGEARSAEGAAGVLGNYFGGTGVLTAEDVDRAYNQYGAVQRAFRDIANKSAGEIAATPAYRSIAQQGTLLRQLGNASTEDDVAQVFKDVARTHEMAFSGQLPTLAITRVPMQAAREAAENANGIVGRLARGVTRLPDAWDDVLRSYSLSEFDPTATDDGTVGIYRMARYTENRNVAASIASEYANAPDLATKLRIYRNLSMSTLMNMAGFRGMGREEYLAAFANDPTLQKELASALDSALGGGMFGREAVYGLDDEGRNLSIVHDQDGLWDYGAGITQNQTGKLRFLDLGEVRRAAKTLAGANDYFGRADQFAFDHITQGIFKPLVLLTPSYAMHISLAELIPNGLRLGWRNLIKAGLDINAQRLGIKADNDDLNAIEGLVYKMVKGRTDDASLAARYVHFNDGHLTPVPSGHDYAAEVADRQERSVSLLRNKVYNSPRNTAKTFGIFGVGNEQYTTAWQAWLKEIANDRASQIAAHQIAAGVRDGRDLDTVSGEAANLVAHYLREMPAAERGRMIRSLPEITSFGGEGIARPADMDSFDDWARNIVANVRGATRGTDRTMNLPLLDHVANGELVNDDELDAVPPVKRPIMVKGREQVPAGNSPVQRLANVGFRKVLNPMVNFLSRQPIAFAEFKAQWKLVEPLIENGTIDEDEAMTLAMNRTVNNVIRNVHNLTDRTQWTVTMRNWAPFYFAQEQAYRRLGRLFAEDPAAFRKYQLMISNIHDVGQIFGGQNGQGYFVMPGTGFLTSGVASAASMIGLPVEGSSPIGMGWNLSSSSVIFPLSAGFRPDIGPLVAIPTQAVAQFFPETLSPVLKSDLTSAENTILGPTATEPIYEQMIPNTIVQRLMEAAFPSFNSRSFNSTMMQVLATLDYQHQIPPPTASAWQMQQFIDKVRNQTRIMYAMKAIVGAVTPVSPELTDQLYDSMNSELSADINSTNSVSKGIQEFLAKHPDATPFTVFQSSNQQGVSIPASVAAENWINNNLPLIRQYPSAALLLMPPNTNTTYNASVYDEQIAQGLRTKWFPGDETPNGELEGYLAQLYVAAGNAVVLDKWYPQYEKQLQGLSGTSKFDAETNWQNTLSAYALQNPIWGTWWNADDREVQRGQAIQQMKALLASPEAPDTQVAQQTRVLLQAYDNYQNQLAIGSQDGFAGQSQSSIDQQWKDNLYATVAAHPEVANVVSGLFLSLPTTQTQSTTAGNGIPGKFSTTNWNQAA